MRSQMCLGRVLYFRAVDGKIYITAIVVRSNTVAVLSIKMEDSDGEDTQWQRGVY